MSTITADIVAAGATDVGQRDHNEDTFHIDAGLQLMLVADGVGGHHGGEVASQLTAEVLAREIATGTPLHSAIALANREVMHAVEIGKGKQGMASTLVVALCDGADYELAWVGDSRAYLWDGQLKLLTEDHSYVQAQLARGLLTLEQARNHPRKNVIVQAIGLQSDDNLAIGQNRGRLLAGQQLLLCSDGLSDVLDSARISELMATQGSLAQRCELLVQQAAAAGGRDNITAVLMSGSGADDGTHTDLPKVYWSFDPHSGEYTGLPLPGASAEAPKRRQLAPKGAPGAEPPGTTQMLSIKAVEALAQEQTEIGTTPKTTVASKPAIAPTTSGRWRLLVAILVASAVATGMLYSLGLAGPG